MLWDLAGEKGIRITLADTPSPHTTRRLLALDVTLRQELGAALLDTALGYTTLTVFFDRTLLTRDACIASAEVALNDAAEEKLATRQVVLPVWYSQESGQDLLDVAQQAGLTPSEVVERHSGRTYFAYANGFAPGFCYLGDVDPVLALPRLATPRRTLPAGSVAIADRQTAVYPRPSPGGWRLIGRCPLALFQPDSHPPTRINVGDEVVFEPIDRAAFLRLGGKP